MYEPTLNCAITLVIVALLSNTISGAPRPEVSVEVVKSLSYDYVISYQYSMNRLISCYPPNQPFIQPHPLFVEPAAPILVNNKPVALNQNIQFAQPQQQIHQAFIPISTTIPPTTAPVDVIPLVIPGDDDGRPEKPTDDKDISCKAILSCLG